SSKFRMLLAARLLMTNSPNTANSATTTPWLSRVRWVLDILRVVEVLGVLLLTLVIMSAGLAQLYIDASALTAEELDGLIPTWQEIEAAWDMFRPELTATHIPATLWATVAGLAIAVGL